MKIKFLPQDIEVQVKSGQSVLNVAQENGVPIRSVCKGVPSCAECRVTVVEGMANVLPPMDAELDLIGTAHFVDQRRLACQMRCFGDLVVDLQDHVDLGMGNAKQPRGPVKKETSESKARMGNVLEEEGLPEVSIEMTEEEKKEAQNLKVKSKDKKVTYAKKMEAGGKNKPHGSKKKSGNKKSGNKNRNKNRNRNKKKPNQDS